MINVYAWPPVGVVGSEWTEEAPVQRSRSIITGKDYISAYARKRRVVTLEVSSLSLNRSGAGYCEMLKRLLQGGVHAVRLNSAPVNWHLDAQKLDPIRRSERVLWQAEDAPLHWTGQAPPAPQTPLFWYTGTFITGAISVDGDFYRVTCDGLPPNMLIARPGDFITVYNGAEEVTAQLLQEATTNADGVVSLRTLDPLPLLPAAQVSIGASDTGVFRPVELPRAVQPLGQNWTYTWRFREIFADEVDGFKEVNPWS